MPTSNLESDLALLEELGLSTEPEQKATLTPRQERIIAGFEEIQRFVEENGHEPMQGADRDIFERIYAVRLDQIRKQAECRDVLRDMDHQGLLNEDHDTAQETGKDTDDLDDIELLESLGLSVDGSESDITKLTHVKSQAEKRAAEEIANREKCEDFEKFKPLFKQVQEDLDNETRTTRPFVRDAGFLKADIKQGQFFILGGQVAYVANVGERTKAPNGETDARLRVIYSNGTESNLLLRSLQRALYKDETGRRITDADAGPLFSRDAPEEDETSSGKIYVLQSKSDLPEIAENRTVIHKIGVTTGDVKKRIANARKDPTYLMADVEIVAVYDLYNINRTKLERILHRVFEPARFDIAIKDRFGNPVRPKEWYLVPGFVIDEAVERIQDGTITDLIYDPKQAKLVMA
ncbi:GIY-YIG nuclease family protein [Thalassospira sp. SN3W]|uniref:GIY-YIG nuclease family protein n=1 Tax=Thalassospira sp. SN3W TaxID=3035476 RepID=UPI00311B259B